MLSIAPTGPRVNYTVLPGKNYYPLRISAVVSETNAAYTQLAATLDWNDGNPPVALGPALKPLSVDLTRQLTVGAYFVTLHAWNYRQPVPDQAYAYFSVEIQPEQVVTQPDAYLYGPILPRDNGAPNASEWSFNLASNLQVLASSVKMLLITAKGERLMLPTYGTSLRRMVFESDASAVAGIAQQEISDALAQFEPRVSLETLNVQRLSDREILLRASFLSKSTQSTFAIALPFTA
jgi:hypothetical protein